MNKVLIRGVYLLLLVFAFIGGRVSLHERPAGESVMTPARPSVLASSMPIDEAPPVSQKLAEAASEERNLEPDDTFAERVAAMLGAGNEDQSAFSQVLEAWVDRDPLGAIDFLARGKDKDNMLRWIVSVWSKNHPEDASRWLAEQQEMVGFDHAVEGLTRGIHREDPEGALEWARIIEDPTVKARVLSASGFQQFRHGHERAVAALADSGLPSDAQVAIQESWATTWKSAAKRNAQNISSVASAASAAGATFEASSEASYVAQIQKGIVIETGSFKGEYFGVPGLTDLEAAAVVDHVRLTDSRLAYVAGER